MQDEQNSKENKVEILKKSPIKKLKQKRKILPIFFFVYEK